MKQIIVLLFLYIQLLNAIYCDWDENGIIYEKKTNQECQWKEGMKIESNILKIDKNCPKTITLMNVMIPVYIGENSIPSVTKMKIIKNTQWTHNSQYYFYSTQPNLEVELIGDSFTNEEQRELQISVEVGNVKMYLINNEEKMKYIQYNAFYQRKNPVINDNILVKGMFTIKTSNGLYGGDGCRYLFTSNDSIKLIDNEDTIVSNCGNGNKYFYCKKVDSLSIPCTCQETSNQNEIMQCTSQLKYSLIKESYSTFYTYAFLGNTIIDKIKRNWFTMNIYLTSFSQLKINSIDVKALNIQISFSPSSSSISEIISFTSNDVKGKQLSIVHTQGYGNKDVIDISTDIISSNISIKVLQSYIGILTTHNTTLLENKDSSFSISNISSKNKDEEKHCIYGLISSDGFDCLVWN